MREKVAVEDRPFKQKDRLLPNEQTIAEAASPITNEIVTAQFTLLRTYNLEAVEGCHCHPGQKIKGRITQRTWKIPCPSARH